jgi:large conductance mechanosensitive channel
MVIRQMNKLKKQPPPPDPTTKDCPFCLTAVPIKATRCGHCTSQLEKA